ncbi:MAG: ATP-dependent DNA helicase RecG, partial [Treponema sp.]
MLLANIKESPLSLKGVGKSFIEALKKLKVETIGELLQIFPRDWEDRTKFNYLSEYKNLEKLHIKATILAHSWIGFGNKKTLKILIEDDLSNKAYLVCFNRNFLQTKFTPLSQVVITGSFSRKYNELSSSSFEIEPIDEASSGILPIYPLVEGLSQKKLSSIIHKALEKYIDLIESDLPKSVCSFYNILEKKEILQFMHTPSNMEEVTKARYALVFEELFFFQYAQVMRYFKRKKMLPNKETQSYPKMEFSELQLALTKRLKFSLTDGQKQTVLEINQDLDGSFPSSRLIQGDVGSGKTLTSFLAILYAIEKKWQVAFLAPTELLGLQHAENAAKLLSPLGVRIAFLSGNVKAKGRSILLKELEKGNVDVIIGTHAIFSNDVVYNNLRLVIIDEQHKFGVLQREALLKKGIKEDGSLPHLIMMSATPIPRSLALSMFGDVDVSTIKTMPQGRKPIKTYLAENSKANRVYDFVKTELKKGHQAYFIYPLIEETETSSFKSVKTMEEELKSIFNEFKISSITSKTLEDEQKLIMKDFIEGKTNILIATSIVEVGVDVPNATCMVIEEAQNFPLTTLHQMRGRVGRGNEQSYCILLYKNKLTENAYKRLKIMKDTNDGFKIAEEDLKIRGPGDVMGTEQSGYLGFKFANPIEDYDVLQKAREAAINFISDEIKMSM